MIFSEYLDSIENTEQEQQLLGQFTKTAAEIQEGVNEAPIMGKIKIIGALLALGSVESIEAFRQSEYYDYLKDWEISVKDLEKGHFSLYPGAAQRKKIFAIAGAVVLAIVLFVWCCKRRCKRKNK